MDRESLQFRLYSLLEDRIKGFHVNAFKSTLIFFIVLNIVVFSLETVQIYFFRFRIYFDGFEEIAILAFGIEYLIRLWVCTVDPRYSSPVVGRVRWALTPLALIDLMAFLPFALALVYPVDYRVMEMLDTARIIRLFKLARYSESLQMFGRAYHSKREEIHVAYCVILVMLVLSSFMMYFVEHDAQPNVFSSIPATRWAASTLTTIGYGDVVPATPLGKVLGAVIAMLGIGTFALPAGILASGFALEVMGRNENPGRCPHCGESLTATIKPKSAKENRSGAPFSSGNRG